MVSLELIQVSQGKHTATYLNQLGRKIMVTFDQLMLPLMKALVNLGGSGSIDEIYEEVVELEKFDEEILAVLHNPNKNSQAAIGYRLAWARTYLKKAGYLENSSRGV
ncbi:MAG: winged helix-turn-helix domain-containing protein [Coxiella endosymbiont of Dermacentor nuttalli]